MDQTGQIILVAAIVGLLVGVTGFWLLSQHGPKGATLGLAILTYVASYHIDDSGSRALHGVVGIVRLIGFIGTILGIIDLFRKPRNAKPSA